jgi:2-oxoglutarate dehydrogenase E2 component (dihydrolipoamide succinyltransferase)
MAFSVTMPALGESVSEGTVTRWLKKEGERVEVDEPLLEVSTDKVDTEIPSPAAGVIQRIVVSEDETVEVGAELAVIGEGAEDGAGRDNGGDEQGAHDEPAAETAEDGSGSAEAISDDAGEEQADDEPASSSNQPADTGGAGSGGGGQGTPVTMPALGESVSEGTVTRWLKSIGDRVEVDEPLLEVSTDKVDTEIPSPVAGFLVSVAVGEDETVPVGAELAVISERQDGGGDSGQSGSGGAGAGGDTRAATDDAEAEAEEPETEDRQAEQPESEQQQPEPQEAAEPQAAAKPAAAEPKAGGAPQRSSVPESSAAPAKHNGGDTSPYVTPLVRKMAAEYDVDLRALEGTGVGGRIRKQDVLEAAARAKKSPEPAAAASAMVGQPASSTAPAAAADESPLRGSTEKMSRLRKVIAARMVESLQTSAQLTTVVEVDLTRIARLRSRAKESFEARENVKLSFLPFFAKATVEALKAHPRVNASVNGDEIIYHAAEHLGVAVDTERGLLVPVIKDAGDLNIAGLARKIADLAERTRVNKIGPDELGGGTFTITNTGSRGALFDTPIINQPQVAILGTGSVVKRPMVMSDPELGETVAIRSMVYLALSYDHRIVDGADAARFLVALKTRLEEGSFESDLGV